MKWRNEIMEFTRWTDDELEYLKENYQDKSYKEIGEYLKRKEQAIRSKLHYLGLKKGIHHRTYNYFETIDTEDKAYWLGFIYADGNINKTKEFMSWKAIKEVFNNTVSKAGTLIMSFKLTVGRVSILDIDATHNEAIISIYPYIDSDYCTRNYLFKVLPLLSQNGETKDAIKGRTLNSTSLSNMLIPLPPLAEQKRIVAAIEKMLPLCEKLGE